MSRAATRRAWGGGELVEPITVRLTVDTRLFRWWIRAVAFTFTPFGELLGSDRVMRIAGWGARLISWSAR